MGVIYLDNAATSWPKPAAMLDAFHDFYRTAGGSAGRAGHRMSAAATRLVDEARQAVAALFAAPDPRRIVFTANATHALNLALRGVLRRGDHVVTTSVEHNSVMRPLRHLETIGVGITVVRCEPDGTIDLERVRRAFRPATKLVVAAHASNVVGALLPVAELAALAHQRGALLLVDASQTAGIVPIDVAAIDVDLLAFTGHKGLLGPTGTGGLYVREGVELAPLMQGGTDSESAREVQPSALPDALEIGTPNAAGLAALGASVRFILEIGVEAIRRHHEALVRDCLSALGAVPGVTVYGPRDPSRCCGLVSFNIAGAPSADVALLFDESFGVLARGGLHCAPAAHRTLGTFPGGAVRFSFSWFNSAGEIDAAARALREIAMWEADGMTAAM
ncbi:MAG TPA: aminotransferase class V-fold PLP-dependent enzyme [Vicinamibacterales bacterium]|nr:aminotransferase class V-fold PLP-dependent enzyme [Vicinamibacterales bacterium]